MTHSLTDTPDWLYLHKDILDLYRFSSSGGSAAIRRHQKSVAKTLNAAMRDNARVIQKETSLRPVCAHLPRALDLGGEGPLAGLVKALGRVSSRFSWQFGYRRMPKSLARKYAFAELLGPRGPVVCSDLILGLVLFAPGTTYPVHAHEGITESYVCLCGTSSENDAGVRAPGSLIFNPPGQQHRITTGRAAPCLLLYAWTGTRRALAEPEMVLDRSQPG
ncbi:MAG: dimethylsulfonioproprionate lyase family protein [Desulfohalobiaceae bacterium]